MNLIKSFMLEDGLVRGTYIAADEVIKGIGEKHRYPESLYPVFRDTVLVALALSAGIKYQGVFSLQIKGKGPVSLVYVDVTTDKKVRGYMNYDEAGLTGKDSFKDLVGEGQLIFSVAGLGQEPYQGIVAIRHDGLIDVVKDYFMMSEQIPTDIIIRTEGQESRCLLIQKMPDKKDKSEEEQADLWETLCVLMNSVKDEELFSEKLTPDEVLFRLFHANKLTVFEPITPVFECRCYRGKMETFLKKMSSEERQPLYNGDGKIEVACQFCGERYTFTKADLGDL